MNQGAISRDHFKDSQVRVEPVDYSALMYFWHWAYMSGDGYANPAYVLVLLDITGSLITELEKVGAPFDCHHVRSKLGLEEEGESFVDGIARVKQQFAANPSVSWAEWITRPLETMADDLQYLDHPAIARVFRMRVEPVLPVAVLGAKAGVDDDLVDWDMKALLPQAERFKLGGMSVALMAHPMAIVIEEGHHCFAFTPESVLGIAKGIAGGAFVRMMAPEAEKVWPHGRFQLTQFDAARFQGTVILHEHGGYRLHLSDDEFQQFISNLSAQFAQPAWAWVLKRHRDLRGDR